MFVGNFLTTGDFITIMPIGLVLSFQYDENGRIEKVLNGAHDSGEDVTSELLPVVLDADFVPRTLPIKDGTSWITGVAYASTATHSTGHLPECVQEELFAKFRANPSDFTFYAGMVYSLAAIYRGAVECRKWLNLAHFKLLPGYPVTSTISDEMVVQMMDRADCPFDISELCGYILYHNGEPHIHYLDFYQAELREVNKLVDGFGYVYGDLQYECGGKIAVNRVEYRYVVNYNLVPNVTIRMYQDDVYFSDSKTYVDAELTCTTCGKLFTVSARGRTCCTDPHCKSRLYGATNQFLKALGLFEIPFGVYQDYTKKIEDYSVVDILDGASYEDTVVEATPLAVIRALVPLFVVNKESNILDRICNKCNNSVNTIQYYIKHPDRLSIELEIDDTGTLLSWLADPYNANSIVKALSSPHIRFIEQGKKFEGAPIFRSWKIAITGEFLHGTKKDIEAILTSYSATIVDNIEAARCLIVGSTKEGVEGKKVLDAKNRGIKIFDEMDFFKEYEIDEDLAANL